MVTFLLRLTVIVTLILQGHSFPQDQGAVVFKPTNMFEGDECTLESGIPGICSQIQHCRDILSSFKQNYTHKPTICSFYNHTSIVCCPHHKIQTTPQPAEAALTVDPMTFNVNGGDKAEKACRIYRQTLLEKQSASSSSLCEEFYYDGPGVVGGEPARPREFPHMAAIGYGERDISWLCGGSLITARYVMTAAHCVVSHIGHARWVRLGDLDLQRTDDDARPQQLMIVQSIVHPQYKPPSLYNDIALLKMERDAVFDDYVRPACLNTEEDLSENTADVTGWGLVNWSDTEGSSHLMKAVLPVQPEEECVRTYKTIILGPKLRNGYDDSSMLCVGDRQGERDTCKGDSGGPYHKDSSKTQLPHCLHVIAGVTSFGKSVCGAVNSPAVYTRVSKYVPWISSIVWP